MFLYVVEDSDTTKNYLKSIYKALFKRQADRVRVPIEFKAVENNFTYPEIKMVTQENPDYQELTTKYFSGSIVGMEIIMSFNGKGENVPLTEDMLRLDRRDVMIQYTRNQFEDNCDIEVSEVNSNNHFGSIFHFIPKNPDALREKAKELGLDITTPKELRENLENTPAKFEEDPPRIIWGDFVIDLPANSKQLNLCMVAFRYHPKKELEWDDIAERIDPVLVEEGKNGRQVIYDIILNLNKKIITKTKKPLFKWTESAFYRMY